MTDTPTEYEQDDSSIEEKPVQFSTSRIEVRLAHLDAQLLTLQERVMELSTAQHRMRQSALWTRVLLLIAALGAYFFIRRHSGGA